MKQINNSSFNILYQNVRGLRTKTSKFLSLLESSDSDLFAITETGCNESINDAEISLPGYSLLRCDRSDGRKQGGVLLMCTQRFELRRIPFLNNINIDAHSFEMVCAAVHIQNRFLFTCCVVYIPPKADESEYMILFNVLEQICVKYKNNVVILGDFNLYSCNVNVCNYFEYFVSFCEVIQCNKVPNCNSRQLDLVLSGRSGVRVSAGDEGLQPVDAYHPPLSVVVDATVPTITSATPERQSRFEHKRPQWNFYKADYQLLYSMLTSADWSTMYEMHNLEEILNLFYMELGHILDECVPRKKFTQENSRYRYPEWYTGKIIKEIKIKAKLHKLFKKSKRDCDYEEYAKCRARLKKFIEIAHRNHKYKIQNQFAKDPKSFWQYIRSKKCRVNRQSIVKDGQNLTDEQCAREFAEFFESVYSQEPPQLDVQAAMAEVSSATSARVHIETLSLKDVQDALANLKPKRSSGPDGIPAFLFRDCSRVLANPLHYIYNTCLKQSTVPDQWKITRVVPVPKGKAGPDISGYRPVAVLSTPAKVFEAAIQHCIQGQVRAQLSDAQHGFRPGRSTSTNLLNFMAQVIPAVDAGMQVDAAYFDFKKAFDAVDNDVLLRKLANIGCTPHLLHFFVSYMRDRQQYVDYNGYESKPYFTRSGVSQGSNLGPLQFIIMINTLPEVVRHSSCLLFADDLKLLLEVKDETDCERLQGDIDRVVKWSHDNKLYFNVSKCSVISYGRARTPIRYEYKAEAIPMQRVTEVRDLGVHLTPDLTFREHITKICKKAYRNLGFVLRQAQGFTNITTITIRRASQKSLGVWRCHMGST
ncbi:unnamed protein product [Chrysodeixis includens]|uniref:Reverse transcriptase domain-containing protein n=1 Tax=Chrysodeixis includens TaxID=689277 RepID=A0A9N8Q1Z7_CHRIL|nr:unnamed protein product [Chrysodeixis includens]